MHADTHTVWLAWSQSQTTAITDPQIWTQESTANTAATMGDYLYYWPQWVQQQEENAEQRAERRRIQAEHDQITRNYAAARKAAGERAERLLEACLTTEQRDQLRKEGCFTVHGRSGNIYQVRRGHVRNVYELRARRTYCCHAHANLPDADHMLAQKLMIETSEPDFLRLANVS